MTSDIVIGKIIFANTTQYYGLELCLHKAGLTAYPVNVQTAQGCDILLVSLFWYRDVLYLENFLRKTGLKNRKVKPIIIAGGMQCSLTPKLIAEMVDYVFVGDGDDYLGEIISDIKDNKIPSCKYIYYKGKKELPEPAECVPDIFLFKTHGLRKKNLTSRKKKEKIRQNFEKVSTVYRLEIARGCKFKCPFCVLSGLKSYREVEAKKIIEILNKIPEHSTIACFAPERLLHSGWEDIKNKILERKFKDFGSDVRLENLERIERDSAILGLEGISYRLRKSIGKNFTNEFILERLKNFSTTGKRLKFGGNLGIYFIADLPNENRDDWKELLWLFGEISKADWSRNLSLKPVLNPLSPKPYTRLYNAEVHPLRDYAGMWEKFLRGGTGETRWGIKLKEYSVWGVWERVIDGFIHRGDGEKVYKAINIIPNKLLLHNLEKYEDSKLASIDFIKRCENFGLIPTEIFGNDWKNQDFFM